MKYIEEYFVSWDHSNPIFFPGKPRRLNMVCIVKVTKFKYASHLDFYELSSPMAIMICKSIEIAFYICFRVEEISY